MGQQRLGVLVAKVPHLQVVEIVEATGAIAGIPQPDQDRDPVGVQPPGDDSQGTDRLHIQPLSIVYQAE